MKLYVSDMDGTLLRNDATLSEFSKNTLNELIHEGTYFTVATARSVVAVQKILTGVRFNLPIIEFNGAFISNFVTGEHEVINQIQKPIAKDLFSFIEKYQKNYFVSSFNGNEDCLYYSRIGNEGMDWFYQDRLTAKDHRLRYLHNIRDALQDQVICFTLMDRKENLQQLAAELHQTYGDQVEIHFFENQYSPHWYWLTIHDAKATKDQAIITLAEMYGYDKEKLVVFGDQTNDIKMFQYARESIAVSNAAEELMINASKVIGSNEEDSVVRFIQEDRKSIK